MAIKSPVDAKLSFGEGDYSDSALPDVLSLNEAQTERMNVNAVVKTAFAGGTSLTIKVMGSDDNSTFEEIASRTVLTADLTEGANIAVAIPDGVNKPYLKVTLSKSGTFTAGAIEAYVDTYMGI